MPESVKVIMVGVSFEMNSKNDSKYILIFHMDIIYMGGEGYGRVLVSGLRGHMYSCGQFTMVYGKSH